MVESISRRPPHRSFGKQHLGQAVALGCGCSRHVAILDVRCRKHNMASGVTSPPAERFWPVTVGALAWGPQWYPHWKCSATRHLVSGAESSLDGWPNSINSCGVEDNLGDRITVGMRACGEVLVHK